MLGKNKYATHSELLAGFTKTQVDEGIRVIGKGYFLGCNILDITNQGIPGLANCDTTS